MMKSKNTKWFTLVELIIVITILAILATIAFVSFQSYTKDARNSKRMSDLASLAQAIEVKLANSINVVDLVDTSGTTRRRATASDILGWYAGNNSLLTTAKYNATNKVNFNVVGAKAEDFRDPKDQSTYLIGATSLAGGVYELATELYETDAGTGARIDGNYKYRSFSNSGAVATVTSITNNQYSFTLSGSNGLGMFKLGDILNNSYGEVIGISSDLTRITMSGTVAPTAGTWVYLSGMVSTTTTEMKSLISGLTGY